MHGIHDLDGTFAGRPELLLNWGERGRRKGGIRGGVLSINVISLPISFSKSASCWRMGGGKMVEG